MSNSLQFKIMIIILSKTTYHNNSKTFYHNEIIITNKANVKIFNIINQIPIKFILNQRIVKFPRRIIQTIKILMRKFKIKNQTNSMTKSKA